MATAERIAPMLTTNQQQLTIELTTPVDDARPVYIVGNFNNWTTDQEKFKMHRVANGRFVYAFPKDVKLPSPLEYKYVRGGWENKELDGFGNTTENRILTNPQGVVRDFVPRWSNYGLTFNPRFLPKIKIVDEKFYIPQLKKERKVTILLPFDYDVNPAKRYPVLYMHDGQNLFNPRSPYGNWAIDQKLAVLAERGMGDIIVVAVDHGGSERVKEFTPQKAQSGDAAAGKKWVRFMATTLKPYIDSQFRTLESRAHTGIGGSSMGGLISIYAGLMFPKVFGRLMIFSPSLWAARGVHFETIHFFQPIPTRIYAYAGGKEGASMVPNVNRFLESIRQQGFDSSAVDFKLSVDPAGLHNEARWGHEFPKAIEWLFFS